MIFGLPKIYAWAQPDAVAADDILQMKQWYLNQHGFIIRAVVYFAIWNFFDVSPEQYVTRAGSHRRSPPRPPHERMERAGTRHLGVCVLRAHP